MDEAEIQAVALCAVDELEETTRIRCGDDLRAGGLDVFQLSFEEDLGHFGLGDIINTRAAATPGAFGEFDEFEAGDAFQKFTRLRGDFLEIGRASCRERV